MANQLEMAGSSHPEKAHHAAPLATTKIFSGYWSNTSPLQEGAVPFLYAKFYGATRNDKIAAGLNSEISPRTTLIRRPGNPVWNSANFSNVTGFYSFCPFQASVGEHVYVIVDTTTAVYVASQDGTPSNVLLYTKASGAGKSRFKQAGDTLYWGDGVSTKKWSWFPLWAANTAYTPGQVVLDSIPGNFQQCLGFGVKITLSSVSTINGVSTATLTYTGNNLVHVGDSVTFYGMTSAAGLNGATCVVTGAPASNQFQVAYTGTGGGENGFAVDNSSTTALISGNSSPTFNPGTQGVALDNNIAWMSWGSSVQNMGIAAPAQAANVANTPVPAFSSYATSTYYWPNAQVPNVSNYAFIVDSNTTPYTWQLTTNGTTAGSVPSGLTSGTPQPMFANGNTQVPTTVTDGTAVWKCNSLATRQTGTNYSLGQVIQVPWTYTYNVYSYSPSDFNACFNGKTRFETEDGFISFADAYAKHADEWFLIRNKNGVHRARLVVHRNWHEEMIDMGDGELVTFGHHIRFDGTDYLPAIKYLSDRPTVDFTGTVYNLEIDAADDDSHHYVLENGIIAHNVAKQEGGGGGQVTSTPVQVLYFGFFMCTTPGLSSGTVTANVGWQPNLGSTTTDGGVVWTNIGISITRTSSSTSSPTGGGQNAMTQGNVSNSVAVTNTSEIQDPNKYGEIPIVAGLSSSSAPAAGSWPTVSGQQFTDPSNSGLVWLNVGQLGKGGSAWVYTYTYVNPITLDESTAAPLSASITLAPLSGITVSGQGSPDSQVGQINIYRSTTGLTTPFRLISITAPLNGQSWSFTDTTPDPPTPGAILNSQIIAPGFGLVNGVVVNRNDPPPTGLTNLEFHAGYMWGTVGNVIYRSTGSAVTSGNGNTAWNAVNFWETPGTVFRLWPTTVGLFALTNDGMWIIQGLGTSSFPFQGVQPVDKNMNVSSYDAVGFNGSQAYVYTSDRLFVSVDPQQGTSWLGQPVAGDLVSGYDPTKVYVTWYSNGLDQKGFITNGSNNWLNFMQVPSPETGWLWNPPATIQAGAGGVGAVAAVKIKPGVYALLIGPSGTGPILQRDSSYTTFVDSKNAYSSWAAFGNIVLAHHGQMAGIVHIGADYVRVGSQPGLSVLIDEILNQASTPEWVQVPNPVNDPPNLRPSLSMYNLRYWLINTQQPIYGRSILTKFDFGKDTVQNELLCFTIFGESHTEEVST